MGNVTDSCQIINKSQFNVRVYVTETNLEMDAFVSTANVPSDSAEAVAYPGGKKFIFRKEMKCTRVQASQTLEVPWVRNHFVSVFVEDDDDEEICYKQLIQNMTLPSPMCVLVYNV
ncbi:hypothetical protein NL108_002011 [Boleophthalmus pectinirostris]|nr:hypothetical protein NL108_002011 [Boleophthalmus pectinirostris]